MKFAELYPQKLPLPGTRTLEDVLKFVEFEIARMLSAQLATGNGEGQLSVRQR